MLIVVAGPNGSGKTTFTTQVLDHQWLKDSEYINPDYVALNNFGDWNDKEAVLKAANYCNEWRAQCLAERRSMIFETVMSAKDKVDFVIRAKRAGFFIRLFSIATQSPVINAGRIANRLMNGGHDVPTDKIISRYPKSIANCKVLSSVVDRLYVYDNFTDGQMPQLLLRLSDCELKKLYVDILPRWASEILDAPHI